MMARDNGKMYLGEVNGGAGSGDMTVTIEDQTYTGPIVRTGSDSSFGFYQAYGGGRSAFGISQSGGGNVTVKAILSSQDGRGLRCDIIGDGAGHGSGICVDDKGTVFDAVFGG